MRRSGISWLLAFIPLLTGACIYGFAGGGLPPRIKSVAVLPFDNETASATLQGELYTEMRHDVESRLGLHEAAEDKADAVVKGTITKYEADIPIAYSADPNQANSAQRKVQITVDVDIIDEATGRSIWSQKGLMRDGSYNERDEATGRKEAIQKIVNDVVAGAQSQW
ncbi:MAG TPA: LPS assembly lipoprotein LptE [Gemmatimonadaceae bacterium]|nr:LPS assembly lipoprotein LptE [Gemmatimonadaceae bacterium]